MGADEWHDPHGLVPEAFKNTFSEHDSVRDALRHAERLPSSTPPEDRAGACPQCGSVGISPIGTGQGDGSANDWKCNECEHRFKEPDKPDMTRYDSTTHTRFNFVTEDELADPDDRDESPIFATLDAETRTAAGDVGGGRTGATDRLQLQFASVDVFCRREFVQVDFRGHLSRLGAHVVRAEVFSHDGRERQRRRVSVA